jgi:hypothetical protein
MATSFNVIINPFKQRICVYARVNKVDCETLIDYKELDEWSGFEFNGKMFDIHIYYDEDIEVSIYEVFEPTDEYENQYDNPSPVKLTIRTKDEF